VEKVVEVDRHVGAAMSGLTADARTLIDSARVAAQNHRFTYDEPMKVRWGNASLFSSLWYLFSHAFDYINNNHSVNL
jgi:20S proteasome alpha/beta subunit